MNHRDKGRTCLHSFFPAYSVLILLTLSTFIIPLPVKSFSPRFLFQSGLCPRHIARISSTTPVQADIMDPLEHFQLPRPLLLGSASFTRKLILKEMGIPFHKVVRPIDEKAIGDRTSPNASPQALVLTLAMAKMDHLVQQLQSEKNKKNQHDTSSSSSSSSSSSDLPLEFYQPDTEWIVLTADQVVTCDGEILEKPESVFQAKSFVRKYLTQAPPSTVGSCVLRHLPSGIQVSGVDTATIYFQQQPLQSEQSSLDENDNASRLVDELIALGEPIMSCAGGLMIEHPLTKQHLDRIDGTEDSVMGLSKDLVWQLLKELAEKVQAYKTEQR